MKINPGQGGLGKETGVAASGLGKKTGMAASPPMLLFIEEAARNKTFRCNFPLLRNLLQQRR